MNIQRILNRESSHIWFLSLVMNHQVKCGKRPIKRILRQLKIDKKTVNDFRPEKFSPSIYAHVRASSYITTMIMCIEESKYLTPCPVDSMVKRAAQVINQCDKHSV